MDDTNLWAGLGEDNDLESTISKGQDSINCWGNNLLAVGGELKPEKCYYTVHTMKPGKDGEWEYVSETRKKEEAPPVVTEMDELDDLWEDMDEEELEDLPPFFRDEQAPDADQEILETAVTVSLIGGTRR